MNVQGMVKEWLEAHGYDGLYNDGQCGCKTADLMPCSSESVGICEPGYESPCDCGDHYFHIGQTRAEDLEKRERHD